MNPKNEEMKMQVYEFVTDFMERCGYPPSYSDISSGLGIAKSTVSKFMSRLTEEGLIKRAGNKRIVQHRTISNFGHVERDDTYERMPVVGVVACGNPILAVEDIQGYIPLDRERFGSGDYFGLVAEGYSMVNIGVFPGDIIYIHRQDTADDGDVVVAVITDDFGEQYATLKRFYRDVLNKRFILRPENDDMDDIVVDDMRIIGVAHGLFRALK